MHLSDTHQTRFWNLLECLSKIPLSVSIWECHIGGMLFVGCSMCIFLQLYLVKRPFLNFAMSNVKHDNISGKGGRKVNDHILHLNTALVCILGVTL